MFLDRETRMATQPVTNMVRYIGGPPIGHIKTMMILGKNSQYADHLAHPIASKVMNPPHTN